MTLIEMVASGQVPREKVDSCFEYILHLQANVAYAKDFHTKASEQLEKANKELKQFENYLANCLDGNGGKLKGTHKELKFRKPSYKIEVVDEKKIPSEFLTEKTTTVVDKAGLKKILTQGEIIEGVQLTEGKKSLIWKNS